MRIALVTGGAGFIGSHLVDRLLDRGISVRVLDNLSTGSLRNLQAAADGPAGGSSGPARGRRLELMIGDIRDERLVRRAMQHVEHVFHLAAVSPRAPRSAEMHAINGDGTVNVLQSAAAEGVRRVVFASCASVYGWAGPGPLSETARPQPASLFAASKLSGEVYCQAFQSVYQLPCVVLRYFNVYGPRQNAVVDGAVVPVLLQQLRRGSRPTIPGDGRSSQDFMYVDDAVQATLAAAETPEAAGQVFNVASGQLASVMEVLDILKRLLRSDVVPRLARPRAVPGAAPRPGTALAREILGAEPRVSLVAGLARVVEAGAEQPDDEGLFSVAGTA